MKYIGCVLIGVAIGFYAGQHYEVDVKVEQKDKSNG